MSLVNATPPEDERIENERGMMNRTQAGIPLYRQIASDIWEQIQTGALKPGEQMPSELELCASYSVNRLTVRQAMTELQRLGAVEIRRGLGTFISSPPDLVEIVTVVPSRHQDSDSMREALNAPSDVPADVENPLPTAPLRRVEERVESFGEAPGALTETAGTHLELSAARLLRLDTVMIRDGAPWNLNSYWFDRDRSAVAEQLDRYETVVESFREGMGLDLVYRWRAFSAAAADYDEARLLEVAAGSALLVRDGVTATADNVPLFYVRRRMRGDDAKFVLRYEDPERRGA